MARPHLLPECAFIQLQIDGHSFAGVGKDARREQCREVVAQNWMHPQKCGANAARSKGLLQRVECRRGEAKYPPGVAEQSARITVGRYHVKDQPRHFRKKWIARPHHVWNEKET